MPLLQNASHFEINGGFMQDVGSAHYTDNRVHTNTTGGYNIQGSVTPGGRSEIGSMSVHVAMPNPNERNQRQYQSVAEPLQHHAPPFSGPNVYNDTTIHTNNTAVPRTSLPNDAINVGITPAVHAQPNIQGQDQALLAVILQMQGQLNTMMQALQPISILAPPSPGVPTGPPTEPLSANALTPTMAGSPITLSAPTIATGTLTPNSMTSSHDSSIIKGLEIPTSLPVVKKKRRWLSWVRKFFGLKLKNKGPELI